MVSITKIEGSIRELKKATKPVDKLIILGSLQADIDALIKLTARDIK
tara:strand:+ start:4418 stop:4558 length:141 start_codon:yes stop_codon:yes gene_type:complete